MAKRMDGLVIAGWYGLDFNPRSHMRLCVFHDERTGSFHYNHKSNRFRCYGASCPTNGESLDVIAFVQRLLGLDFNDALNELVAPTGDKQIRKPVPVKDIEYRGPRRLTRKDREALSWVADHYHDLLMSDDHMDNAVVRQAREYLASRAISRETAVRLGVGVADGRSLLAMCQERPSMGEALLDLEVLTKGKDGRGHLRERFGGFITVPNRISDKDVDFISGRTFRDDGRLKFMGLAGYMKPIYGLGNTLREAGGSIAALHLTEGLFDGLTLMHWGLPGAVAMIGQMGPPQMKQLEGFRLYVSADNDDGGREMTARLAETLGEENVAVVELPENVKDVGDLATMEDGYALYQQAARAAQARMGWDREGGLRPDGDAGNSNEPSSPDAGAGDNIQPDS